MMMRIMMMAAVVMMMLEVGVFLIFASNSVGGGIRMLFNDVSGISV